MSWLETKYIGVLSTRFRNYKRKSGTLWNFSCPLCGDSQKNQRTARGYIYVKEGKYLYHCHNGCGTMGIPKFIKAVDEFVYNDFLQEKIMDDNQGKREPDPILNYKKPKYVTESALKELKKVSQLPHEHFCKEYVVGRQIPNTFHHRLFFAPKFMSWCNRIIPDKFNERALRHDGPALVIPFVNKEGRLHAFQGRYFEGDVRYITLVTDESVPKLWGLDHYDKGNRSYVLEGPIDAMFLPNGVATAGGVELHTLRYLNLDNSVIVFDNEPRSRETVAKIEKCIRHDMKVCIWPEGLHQKDVNDMILHGNLSADHVREIIDRNTFSGLRAELQLNNWKRV
jgi:transcription elongation factor Elf1